MSNIKEQLLKEIDNKIQKKKEAKERAASNKNVETFIADFMQEVEEINANHIGSEAWDIIVTFSIESLKDKIKTIDSKSDIEVSWYTEDQNTPRVNGVIVKWSKYYQIANNCDPELFIDIAYLLLR